MAREHALQVKQDERRVSAEGDGGQKQSPIIIAAP